MKVRHYRLAVWTVLFLLLSGAAHASTSIAGRMVLILDGSGSMWGKIDGKSKIEIAKEVMGEVIDGIPADFETGLMVYGHRVKGDCSDIEMVVPVGAHNTAALKGKVRDINPKGKTPLSEAVRQAAEALRYTEERATVILVSDGLETCEKDPCAVASELAMSGVDFTVHVIGFDISREDQGRLRCLADKTGGLFLAADNAGSLRDALRKTVDEVKAPPAPIVEQPGKAELQGPATVPVGAAFSVQWQGPNSLGDYIAIAEKGSQDSTYSDYAYTKRGNPAELTAPGEIGDYELRYIHAKSGQIIGRADIEVTQVQAAIEVPKEADIAANFEVNWQGPSYQSDYITIAKPDQGHGEYIHYTYTAEGSPLKLLAPSEPGTYEVRYILGKDNVSLANATIQIKPVSASVTAPAAADAAATFEVAWQGPGNDGDYITIAKPEQEPGEYMYYTYTKEGSPLRLQAPSEPGTYEVRYVLGQDARLLAKTVMDIKPVSASVTPPAAADAAAKFEVTWQGPGNEGDYITIAKPEQGPGEYMHYTYTKEGSPLKLQAPSEPGTYEVRYILGQDAVLLAKTAIDIKPVSASVTAPAAADAAAKFEVAWQGPGNDGDYISIAKPEQNPGQYMYYTYTRAGSPLKLQAPSEPGTFEVRYILGHGNRQLARTAIAIKPVSASVTVPAAAEAKAKFEVTWQGPGNDGDYISIAKPEQAPGQYKHYTYTRAGSPLKLEAPSEPGTYEVRYILGLGNKMLNKATITIQ